ncbi:MAG: hypothetical protein ABIP28_11610 [Mucilaginibacter sp.]
MKIISLFVLLSVITACIESVKQQKTKVAQTKVSIEKTENTTDSTFVVTAFTSAAKINLELLAVQINIDTLIIVLSSSFFNYPFGKFNSMSELNYKYKNIYSFKTIFSKNIITPDSTLIYRMSINKSYVNFLLDDDKGRIEILSGNIVDTGMPLQKGIRVGMSKSDLLKIFFKKAPPNNINTVKIISAVAGMWHYYTFKADKLQSITFDTDYLINK